MLMGRTAFLSIAKRKFPEFSVLTLSRRDNSSSPLEIEEKDGVRQIVMADLRTKNSLSLNMVSKLTEAIVKDEDNTSLRCIVISAKGSVFSSGFNLKELADPSCRRVFEDYNRLMMSLVKSPVPVLAAVDGLAAAAGCQLVAQCDMAVCTSRSSFSTPGANFGIFCSTPGIPLVRSVGRKMSSYMLFTGYPLSADEACRAGLVSHVTTDNKLDDIVNHITDGIKSKSREVIKLGKQFLYQQLEMTLSSAYEKGATIMRQNLELPDGVEGVKSFVEKRKPQWK